MSEHADLPKVLLSTSFIEQRLAALLHQYFINGDTTRTLLSHTGIIGTLSARADLAYCLGLISKAVLRNIRLLGEIRNRFAHNILGAKFEDPDITDLCGQLSFPQMVLNDAGPDAGAVIQWPDALTRTPKNRHMLVSTLLIGHLQSISHTRNRREAITNSWDRGQTYWPPADGTPRVLDVIDFSRISPTD